MVYTPYLWCFGGWFMIVWTTWHGTLTCIYPEKKTARFCRWIFTMEYLGIFESKLPGSLVVGARNERRRPVCGQGLGREAWVGDLGDRWDLAGCQRDVVFYFRETYIYICIYIYIYIYISIGLLSHRIRMYAIYGNIYHQYTPYVSIYTIHGSYGYGIDIIIPLFTTIINRLVFRIVLVRFTQGMDGLLGVAGIIMNILRIIPSFPDSLRLAPVRDWLVVWLPSILFSHINWVSIIIPIDELIFFRGVAKNHQPEIASREKLKAENPPSKCKGKFRRLPVKMFPKTDTNPVRILREFNHEILDIWDICGYIYIYVYTYI